MYPAQSALHVRQAGRNSALERGVGDDTIPSTLDDPLKPQARVRHKIHIRSHTRLNILQLRLAKIRNHPPDPGVDQRENLLAYVSIGTFGNDQAGHTCVEWSIDAALVVVVLCVGDCRGPPLPLRHQGIKGKYAGL